MVLVEYQIRLCESQLHNLITTKEEDDRKEIFFFIYNISPVEKEDENRDSMLENMNYVCSV